MTLRSTSLDEDDAIEAPIRVIAINGSLREGSYTRMALVTALKGAAEVGAITQLVDLDEYDLPFATGKVDKSTAPPGLLRLRAEVRAAQGIILGTPEYHSSLSGVLKNALDLMSFDEFEGKMIGLIGLSGGRMGAINALNTLRTISRSLHAWVIPEQISISEAWNAFEPNGRLRDRDLEQRVLDVGRYVTRFAYLHSSEKAQEFLRLWESAPANPGG